MFLDGPSKQQYRMFSERFNFSTILSKNFQYLNYYLFCLLQIQNLIKCLNWFSWRKYFCSMMTYGLSWGKSCIQSSIYLCLCNIFYFEFCYNVGLKRKGVKGTILRFQRERLKFFLFNVHKLHSSEISTSEIEL